MDIVYIEELAIDTIIGIHDWERTTRQTLVLDLQLAWDNRVPAASRQIGDALDYDAVSTRLLSYVQASQCLLIETLAEELAQLLQDEFGVRWLRLKLAKPGAVPAARSVGIVIERGAT